MFLVAPTSADPPGPARLGLVVTKKVGNAVQRNRIKRLARACFRLWPEFVPDGVDLVVIARQGAAELALAQVQREWARARGALVHRVADVLAQAASRPHVPGRPAQAPLPARAGDDDRDRNPS